MTAMIQNLHALAITAIQTFTELAAHDVLHEDWCSFKNVKSGRHHLEATPNSILNN